VRGIVSGSTNFVLTSITSAGASYDDVVAQAKSLGFLEADPSADVEGRDAADKLAILIRLAFGVWPDVSAIRRAPPALSGDAGPGITAVDGPLLEAARREGLVVKLVAAATQAPDGHIGAWVLPAAVPAADPLARTEGSENRIEVDGAPVGMVAFVGPGAGGVATSSAVLGDVLAIARGRGSTWSGLPEAVALPADRLVDGMDASRRWLAHGAGGTSMVGPVPLEDARRQLASDSDITLFPVLEMR
jgi:homoserine dehydrogenase